MFLRHHRWTAILTIALVATMSWLSHGTALAQQPNAATEGGPPSVVFIIAAVVVFVGVVALFLVFGKSQGCGDEE
jgi:uncharacterized membrane protein